MSVWAIGTWAAIFTLCVGSVAVFVWFLSDALRLLRKRRAASGGRAAPGP